MWSTVAAYFYGRHRERKHLEEDAELIIIRPKPPKQTKVWGKRSVVFLGIFAVLWLIGVFLMAGNNALTRREAEDLVFASSMAPRSAIICAKRFSHYFCIAKDAYGCHTYRIQQTDDNIPFIKKEQKCYRERNDLNA